MSSFSLQAVQQALYAALIGDMTLMNMVSGVYDAPPQHAAVPYVVIGDGQSILRPQINSDVSECNLELHVWTTASGRKVALAILNRLHDLLHQESLTISGFTFVAMVVGKTDTQLDANNDRILGRLELTITARANG